MLLQKTEKARTELRPGMRTLGQRERSLLLLADGNKSLMDLRGLFDGEGEQIALALVRQGYLEPVHGRSGFHPESSGTFSVSTTAFMALTPQASAPAPLARSTAPAPLAKPPAPAPQSAGATGAADSFEGKRSLATTRMFLFDLCERMFARRDPALAEQFREALRNAKDPAAMLSASRDMIAEIERVAGPERADSISERIAMLLPPDVVN